MNGKKNGISVIVCSIKPQLCEKMLESVKNTIGIDYETIVFDNRESNFGLCQIYNQCAEKAKFKYLCFIHEDVILPTPNWGLKMIEFAEKTENCGVIGFAGGTIARKNFLIWEGDENSRYRFYDPNEDASKEQKRNSEGLTFKYNNPHNEDFAKVTTLDGVFLFVNKSVWEQNRFDEVMLNGFHFYDADFSLNIAQTRQNYVCLSADIYHFSCGNQNKGFYENARIFQKKWKYMLPYDGLKKQRINLFREASNANRFLMLSVKSGLSIKSSIIHSIRINGLFLFLVFWALEPLRIIKNHLNSIRR